MAKGTLRVIIPIQTSTPAVTGDLSARYFKIAQAEANRRSATPVTDLHLVRRFGWDPSLGPAPDDLVFEYLMYEGTGTQPDLNDTKETP